MPVRLARPPAPTQAVVDALQRALQRAMAGDVNGIVLIALQGPEPTVLVAGSDIDAGGALLGLHEAHAQVSALIRSSTRGA